ncbi:hypothetical protein P6U16_11965 [Rhizobium sp. 32-5/1]|uniref:hypothetical protein n=1 Tax=Rhizobium sp. 32-5/1 TaxID=3019602 RepID=UPI00240D7AAD|nr:hypothetical protein [Rhizobium sp. 32-5/1]WEZ81970.1 hypothetical protein P6U16_11965 [Rhizobium sp. 32-5/1]
MNVSRIVSRHVQSDVSPDAEMISGKKRNRKLKKRSSGLYLVRSGGIYLFQIRLPKRIGGGAGSRPIPKIDTVILSVCSSVSPIAGGL